MDWIDALKGGVKAASGSGVASSVIGAIGKVSDKLWVDKNVRDTNMAAISIAVTDAERDGTLAEFEDEADRRKDIRESGWLSRQVRPIIALTFHFAFWGGFFFDPAFSTKIAISIFKIYGIEITLGAMYVLVVCFYFLTKGLKDMLISKNPIPK